MSFNPASLFVSLLAGSVGLVLFVYGKKQGRMPQLAIGLVFMVYPYFVESAAVLAAIGLVLGGGLWWMIQLGW